MKRFLSVLFLLCALPCGALCAELPAPVRGTVTLLNLRSDCLPCDLQDRVVARVEEKYRGRVAVVSVDAEKDTETGAAYGVKTLPTLIFYDAEGNVVHRMDGGYMKQNTMDKIFKELLK